MKDQINRDTQQLFEMMHLKLDPRTKVADLTVAKQQMVEIAKALSFNSEVLIMDEPTAALTETEIDDLFRIVRQLREKGVGIVHISHRLEEFKQISDRITVMRDGHYIDTVATKDATIDQIISMMVGRTIYESTPELPEVPSQEIVLEVKNLNRGQVLRDVSFNLKKGEILGFAGLMGAGRTEVARAIFGADPMIRARSSSRASRCISSAPSMRSSMVSAICRKIASATAWRSGWMSRPILCSPHSEKFVSGLGWVNTAKTRKPLRSSTSNRWQSRRPA